jgi:hypothetical protein
MVGWEMGPSWLRRSNRAEEDEGGREMQFSPDGGTHSSLEGVCKGTRDVLLQL